MKKLNKDQIAARDAHSTAINDAHSDLDDAINRFNALVEEAKGTVESATETYNQALDNARTFCAEIVSLMEDYEGERSDKWHESDAASSFQDWKSEWESIDLDQDFDPEFPVDLEAPDNPQETLDMLPEEASS